MAKILVIDDALDIRETIRRVLHAQGHTVDLALDGMDGMLAIQNSPPDLILLDLTMPRLSGMDLLKNLKSSPDFNIPIVILTAEADRDRIIECLELGANDYVIKPFNLHELIARINVQLRVQFLEREIRESEIYHRMLFERTSDPEMVVTANGEIRQINDAALDLMAIAGSDLMATQIYSLIAEDHERTFRVAFAGALEGSAIPIFEVLLALPHNRLLPVDVDLASVTIRNEPHLLIHLRDISRRKSAEAQSLMILQHIGDAVVITDQNGVIMMASRSASHFTGYPEDALIGVDIAQFHGGENPFPFSPVRDSSFVYAGLLRQKEGETLPVEWRLATFEVAGEIFCIGVVRDMRDRLQVESQRIEADRLKTLLEVAGGAAHEINQPLTTIMGYAEMSQGVLPVDQEAHRYQQQIIASAARISDILKKMQTIRSYQTRPYTHGHEIVDFVQSSQDEGGTASKG
ncbi:MAG: response regulator [bacterium]|nr:response regulator [bacterium]